jgi:Nif-specific regulatory protein
VPQDLVESAFFGHKKGSFTGATSDRQGYFELADQGTLFLDEIGEAPVDLQVKLLRVLQEGRIFPVGAQKEREVDVRIIASTNRNLSQLVDENSFRQDLFFRLNVFSVLVPPLRARREDVEVLADFFLSRSADRLNKEIAGFSEESLKLLITYEWPGNVRELENEVERLAILCDTGNQISADMLSERIRFRQDQDQTTGGLKEQLAQLEKSLILNALKRYQNNKSHAAEALGITRQTIITKLKQYQES